MIKIFDHIWIKITALLLGLLLWFHVATEKIYTYQLNLPISSILLENQLTLSSNPPESLMVTVSATGKQLMRKKWRDRGLKIVATQFETGKHNLSLNTSNTSISSPISDVTLEEIISPASISLIIDHIGEKKVKVSADISTEPAEGFAVSSISSIIPDEVTLIGPRSILQKIDVVFTEQKSLNQLRDNLDLTLPLAIPSGYGIMLKPDTVDILIEVVPVKTRVFENLPIVIYNSPTNRPVTVSPYQVRVEVTGPPTEIDLLNMNALSASVDFRVLTADSGKAKVTIDCPLKFRVKNVYPDSVSLYIQ